VKAENLYHTGIVVDDLEATMDWFTKTAGYTWTDVVTVDQQGVTPAGEITIPMKMVYSGCEPRLELLQTVAGTVWMPADSGVHHIGYWSDDVESDLAALESGGMTCEVKSYNPDGSGLFSGPTRRGRPDHASNSSAAGWSHSSPTGGRLRIAIRIDRPMSVEPQRRPIRFGTIASAATADQLIKKLNQLSMRDFRVSR
jgi:hypothetical protein